MPTYSEDTKKEHIALIRRILVQRPDASLREIREALDQRKRHLHIDYINSLVHKIQKEWALRSERQLVSVEIAKFEDAAKFAFEELWKISRTSSDDRAKVQAVKAVIDTHDKLLGRKFDAGVFEKNLGSVKINHNIAEYKISIIQAFENSRLFNNSSGQQGGNAPAGLQAG